MDNGTTRDDFPSDLGNNSAVHLQEVLKQVRSELCQLLQQRADLMQRICSAKKTIVGLSTLLGDPAPSDELRELLGGGGERRKSGLTQTCRLILMNAVQPMSAREVCDQIQGKEPMILAGHKDPMASVTTILSRLAHYGEAKVISLGNGRRGWQWATEPVGSNA